MARWSCRKSEMPKKANRVGQKAKLELALHRAVECAGPKRVREVLDELGATGHDGDVLTIIVNEGIHVLGVEYRRGQMFAASRGSLDFSTSRSITLEYRKVLART